jgi:hypothetical protein
VAGGDHVLTVSPRFARRDRPEAAAERSRIFASQLQTIWVTTSASTRFSIRSMPAERSVMSRISARSRAAEPLGRRLQCGQMPTTRLCMA